MAVEKNIFITSLSSRANRKQHSYYRFKDGGQVKYCDGLSVAEAGAKYLLSSVAIDEIIAVGGWNTHNPDEDISRLVLKDWASYSAGDTDALSEYGFFQYRISQYLNGLDLEAVDVLEDMTEERRTELLNGYQKLLTLLSQEVEEVRPDRVFHVLSDHENHAKILREAFGDLSDHDLLWLKRYFYTQLSGRMKLVPRQDSEGLTICFVPTGSEDGKRYVPAQNVNGLIRVLRETEADVLNIYMDMQGLESAEGYMIIGILAMLAEDRNNPICFREIITTKVESGSFVNVIDNSEMKRYEINRLVSGMSAFIRYGKVDEILNYWNSRDITDLHVDYLLYAMKRIDEGISLCNISQLESGIRLLKLTLDHNVEEAQSDVESDIFRILENTIRMDYGSLLEGEELDELELVRWALRKKFYQQAITIIESRMPQDFVKRRILYYAEDEVSQKEFLKELNRAYWETLPKDRWSFKDIEHYFIKFYGRNAVPSDCPSEQRQSRYADIRVAALNPKDETFPLKKAYSVLADRPELVHRILLAYYDASQLRNHINHAEETEHHEPVPGEENPHLKMLVDGVNDFIEAYDAVRSWMKEQNLSPEPPLLITEEKLKNYSFNHKPRTRNPNQDLKKDRAKTGRPEGTRKPDSGNAKRVEITISIDG